MEKITDLKKLFQKLLDLVGLKLEFEVSGEKGLYKIVVKEDETAGLVIGRRGETLYSLQYLLSLALRKNFSEEARVLLEVGSWREKQEEYLRDLAQKTAQKAIATGEEIPLYNLNPSQRRTIHLYLSENEEVTTYSEGEGRERKLIVKKK